MLPAGPLQALTPVNARVEPLARLLLFFTVTIMLLQIFTSALGIKDWRRVRVRAYGGLSSECDRLVWFLGDDWFGTAGYCHSCSAISRGYRRNVLKGTATVAVQANRSKGTATVAVRYREEAAGTSGAAHPEEGSKISCRQDPARQLARFSREH